MSDQGKPSFIKYVVMAGLPFGLLFGSIIKLHELIQTGNPSGFLFVVIASGLFFGIAVAAFARSSGVQKAVQIQLPEGETVEYSGVANHFMKAESRGGYLYLTNKNLIFKPHNINVQKQSISISLNDITKVWFSMSLGIVPNGLSVETKDGQVNKFVVMQRGNWKKNILAQSKLLIA